MRAKTSSKVENIFCILVERISMGTWPVGVCLPTEFELAEEFDCGRHTVSQAVTRLVHEGLVERRRRVGSRVISNAMRSDKPAVALDAFAFIYPSDRHEGMMRISGGFQDAAREQGRRVVTLTIGDDHEKEFEFISRLSEFDVKAAAIYPVVPSPDIQAQLSSLLAKSKFPIVLTELNIPGLGCPSVTVDGFHAGYTMTRYLLESGLSRVGFFANHSWSSTVAERYRGYLWAIEAAGKPLDSGIVLLEPEMIPNFEDPLRAPTQIAHRYLDMAPGVEGVVCSNDYLARGLIRAAQARGLQVPKDLKITGIDGFDKQPKDEIPLTTYQIAFEELGRKAFGLLDALLLNKTIPELETRVRGEVVVRKSA